MKIKNSTHFSVSAALQECVLEYPTDELTIELKYSPRTSSRYISGTYYRVARDYENGGLIRLRINRANRYPIEVPFKTSEYFTKQGRRGETITYQKMRNIRLHTPEDLILAIFLHEFSHYMDHVRGLNGRYKQTKADKFALATLERLGVI